MTTALIVGLDPTLLDDPTDPIDTERVQAGMQSAIKELHVEGIDGELFLLAGPSEDTLTRLSARIEVMQPNAIMLGAGVRLEPSLSWFLERLVNMSIDLVPGVRLCFNEDPEAMATAVLRVLR